MEKVRKPTKSRLQVETSEVLGFCSSKQKKLVNPPLIFGTHICQMAQNIKSSQKQQVDEILETSPKFQPHQTYSNPFKRLNVRLKMAELSKTWKGKEMKTDQKPHESSATGGKKQHLSPRSIELRQAAIQILHSPSASRTVYFVFRVEKFWVSLSERNVQQRRQFIPAPSG